MSVILQLFWVAAYHGMRRSRRSIEDHARLWSWTYDITRELGYPPAPGPHGRER